jgi:prepilin-type N-terminal cleavage/methylation domain-containing protein
MGGGSLNRALKNTWSIRICARCSGRRTGRDRGSFSRRGGTLIELITVLVVLTIIAVLTGNSFKQAVSSFNYLDKRKEVLSEARVA